jgi:uncharacterized protein (DUF302 family)
MKYLLVAAFSLFSTVAMAQDASRTVAATGDVKDVAARFVSAAKAKGFTIFAEVDHAAGAQGVGMALRPTHLILFGNPRGGTPLMNCKQTAGLDLPMRVLVWQGADNAVNITYAEPAAIASAHNLGDCGKMPLENASKAIAALSAEAAKAP